MNQDTIVARFMAFIEKTPGCWLWTGAVAGGGYGYFYLHGDKLVRAHRFSYELFVGPIPDGLVIDHVKARGCTNRLCVNPDHLEAVTRRENTLRGDNPLRLATHCKQGHPYSAENTRPYTRDGCKCRVCRTCERVRTRARRARAARRDTAIPTARASAQAVAAGSPRPSHAAGAASPDTTAERLATSTRTVCEDCGCEEYCIDYLRARAAELAPDHTSAPVERREHTSSIAGSSAAV
jgi:hypothetical protein